MKAYTDAPIEELGDISGEIAPIRECEILSYDEDKYCMILETFYLLKKQLYCV